MPTYSVWFENSMIDTTTPTSIATGPAQLVYLVSNSSRSDPAERWRRRRNWSQNITASHGAIQYAMTSRKFSYLVPASCSPVSATMKPITPNTDGDDGPAQRPAAA